MAHNLEYNAQTGRYNMFCTGNRDAAWHKLGQRTDRAVTWREAMELAGLNWDVIVTPMTYPSAATGETVTVPNHVTIQRSTDGACLGVVGKDYGIVQNRDAFAFVDDILESENGASHYESAGALGNGERIWTMARIPNSDFSPTGLNDPHETYLLFTTSHDGSMAGEAKLTTTRVVCQNTLNIALSGAGEFCRFRHTKNVQQRMSDVKKLMTGVAQNVTGLKEKLETLSQRRVTRESMTAVLDRLFPKPKADKSSETSTRRDNLLADVIRLYEINDGGKIGGIAGTAYNLLNAVTEYTDHLRTARLTSNRSGMTQDQARAENALFGTGDKLKTTALEVILQETNGAPRNVYVPVTPNPSVGGSLLDQVLASTPAR